MSGLIGHTLYAILAEKAVRSRGLPVASILARHRASFHCGAYLGCDIQVMPEAICVDTGREVGFGTVPLEKSPVTGGEVRPWALIHGDQSYRPDRIHELFYGRSHLVFGWKAPDLPLRVPWDHLADYCSLAIRDRMKDERGLAYALGWMVHIVGDSLIKSIHPGIRMYLLDGIYTPRNRVIQDQFSFHVIGTELGIDWPKTFADMAATPIEPIQAHYMRIADPQGELGTIYSDGWEPGRRELLAAVLAENRRWLPHHARDVLRVVTLTDGRASEEARRLSHGLEHDRMIEMAEAAGLRKALVTIADASADLIDEVVRMIPDWASQPRRPDAGWRGLKERWRVV